jgi:hypothetical protein
MKSIVLTLLSISFAIIVDSTARAQSTQLSPPSFSTPLGYVDWESVAKAEELPPWYRSCSCYYTGDCRKTKRGILCSWVGDCMGNNRCVCRSPKPRTQVNGAFVCGDPAVPGQCDGLCIKRREAANWSLLARAEAARFADLVFQAYVGAAREGGHALVEPLREAGRLNVTGDWQLEIEGAVDHVLMTLLGRDFLPATAHSRAGGEPRGQVLRTSPAGIKLLDTVREAFVAALAGRQPVESVDRAITEFWKKGDEYAPHHGGRCYPHGHPEYEKAAPCQISEVRAALDLLLEGTNGARAE